MGISQDWDSTVAPALPGTWNYTPGGILVAATSLGGGLSPTSSPNVLAIVSAGLTTPQQWAAYPLTDTNAGNVSLQANFAGTGNSSGLLFCRSNQSPPGSGAFYYSGGVSLVTGLVSIAVATGGAPSTLTSLTSASLASDAWYTLFLSAINSVLTFSLQRMADSEWLNPSGSFQATQVAALTVSDSTISGSGYFGVALAAKSASSYTDDFSESEPSPITWGFPGIARIAHEGEFEPGRVLASIGQPPPPTPQLARARMFVAQSEAPPQESGRAIFGFSRTPANVVSATPPRIFATSEAPPAYPGAAIFGTHGGPAPPPVYVATPVPLIARAEERAPDPGQAIATVNLRVETPLARQSHPLVAAAEPPPSPPGSAQYYVNPHHDRRIHRGWVARGEDARPAEGSAFASSGMTAHINPFKLPAIMAQAESPPAEPGRSIVDTTPLPQVALFSQPPHVVVASAEAPPSPPGSIVAAHAPLVAIAPSTPPPGLVVSAEPPPVHPGQAIIQRAPLATPLLSSRVYVAMAEAPPAEPGRALTSLPPAQPPPGLRASQWIAQSEPPPVPAGSVFARTGEPPAVPLFSHPAFTVIAWAEPMPMEPGRFIWDGPGWPELPPFVIYVDPRKAVLGTMDSDFTEVDPRKARLGPEYPTS